MKIAIIIAIFIVGNVHSKSIKKHSCLDGFVQENLNTAQRCEKSCKEEKSCSKSSFENSKCIFWIPVSLTLFFFCNLQNLFLILLQCKISRNSPKFQKSPQKHPKAKETRKIEKGKSEKRIGAKSHSNDYYDYYYDYYNYGDDYYYDNQCYSEESFEKDSVADCYLECASNDECYFMAFYYGQCQLYYYEVYFSSFFSLSYAS